MGRHLNGDGRQSLYGVYMLNSTVMQLPKYTHEQGQQIFGGIYQLVAYKCIIMKNTYKSSFSAILTI